jgi:hypothetical protein
MSKTVKSQTVNQWFDSFLLVAGGKSLIMVNRPDMISQELLRTESEGEIWSEMVESIGEAPAVNSMWVSVGNRGSDIFSYIRRTTALHWYCLLRVTQNRVIPFF